MQVHREPCFEKHDLKSQNFPKFCFLSFFSLVSLFCLHSCDLNSPFCEKWLGLWGLEGTVYNAGLNSFLLIWTYLSFPGVFTWTCGLQNNRFKTVRH